MDRYRRSATGLRRLQSKLSQDSLYEVFKKLDKDESGTLGLDEVSVALENLGESIDKHELERLMGSLDTSKDGSLDFREFTELIDEVMKLKKLTNGKFETLDAGDIEARKRGQIFCWSIVACISYVIVGYLYGSYVQGWGFIDSIYFVVATVSTVGYGDRSFIPGNKTDKIFGCFYVFFGVACVSCALGLIIDVLSEAAKNKMDELRLTESLAVVEGGEMQFDLEKEIRKLYQSLLRQSMLILLTTCIGACCFVELERDQNWSFVDGLYFACVTMTTVGYGDLEVQSDAGKMFASIYILIALGVIATAMSELANLPSEMRRLANLDKVLSQFGESLDECELEALCDGEEIQQIRNQQQIEAAKLKPAVSRAEFALWQLLKQGKVDLQGDVAPCLNVFDKLDYDGSGSVTREDITQRLKDKLFAHVSKGQRMTSSLMTAAEVVADPSRLEGGRLSEASQFATTVQEHAESLTPYLRLGDEVSELAVRQRNAFEQACAALRRARMTLSQG